MEVAIPVRSGKKNGQNKNRKYHRDLAKCKRYRDTGRRERNKLRKLRRHLKKQPDDLQAFTCLKALEKKL